MRKLPLAAALATMLWFVGIADLQAQMSIDEKYDINQLMQIAEDNFDPAGQDAVLLLDKERIDWTADGRRIKHIHRIIWINSFTGISRYGDHRIAYDAANCYFKTTTVRTWRDNRWWESGETGIVETLPRNLRRTPDYTNVREMMLLHNGIELPCILEVAYTIEDKTPFRSKIDGLFVFARREPVVKVVFELSVPGDLEPTVFVSPEVTAFDPEIDSNTGMKLLHWGTGPIAAAPIPETDNPVQDRPYILWSFWNNWSELGEFWLKTLNGNAVLNEEIKAGLDSLLEKARTNSEKADLAAEFVTHKTAFVDYNDNFWFDQLRLAQRVYNTAYGHRSDRAILAGAALEYCGLTVNPVFLGQGYGEINTDIASMSLLSGINLWISGADLEAVYDPKEGSINNGLRPVYGRAIWMPGIDAKPALRIRGDKEPGRIQVDLEMEYDPEKKKFTGRGLLMAENCLCPYGEMIGFEKESQSFLNSIVNDLLNSGEVQSYNLIRFDLFGIKAGFRFEMDLPEEDDYGRIPIKLGFPEAGLFGNLPDDADLLRADRGLSVELPCLMSEEVTLKINGGHFDLVYLPESVRDETETAVLEVDCIKSKKEVTISRRMELLSSRFSASQWPDLRSLLLMAKSERNNFILLSPESDTEQ
jgi:hypothetical protein